MLICFQAMKESGVNWPLITEDEQEWQGITWYEVYNHQYPPIWQLKMAIASNTDNEILHEVGARLRAYRLQMRS